MKCFIYSNEVKDYYLLDTKAVENLSVKGNALTAPGFMTKLSFDERPHAKEMFNNKANSGFVINVESDHGEIIRIPCGNHIQEAVVRVVNTERGKEIVFVPAKKRTNVRKNAMPKDIASMPFRTYMVDKEKVIAEKGDTDLLEENLGY